MTTRHRRNARLNDAHKLAQGHGSIPTAGLRRAIEHANSRVDPRVTEKMRSSMAIATALRPSRRRKNAAPRATLSEETLHTIATRIARRSVRAPKFVAPDSGILDASYSLRLTPGYTYGDIAINQFRYHEPATSVVVQRHSGRMGFSYLADNTAEFGKRRHVSVMLGTFVIPLFEGTLTAHVEPTLSFSWWAIAHGAAAWSLAGLSLSIVAYSFSGTHAGSDAVESLSLWERLPMEDDLVNNVTFDFGSRTVPLTTTRTVDPGHFYLVSLTCDGAAGSNVYPPFSSISGGTLDLALPFIDLSVRYLPLATL